MSTQFQSRLVMTAPSNSRVTATAQRLTPPVAPRRWVIADEARQRMAVASAWAAQNGWIVYRIDLRQVVSKYIGETEKNLNRLFARAGQERWLLFFDEADALFGKRSEVKDAHDRYANATDLLWRHVAAASVPVFLASRRQGNLDEAILRRLQIAVTLPSPRAPG